MQPALIETRNEVLHGQRVEVKVYGPGCGHKSRLCLRGLCPLCQISPPEYDGELQGVEGLWPVALGIEPGYTEPVSGHTDTPASAATFDPRSYTHRFEPKVDPHPTARADFFTANLRARYRLQDKRDAMRAKCKPWTPERRKAAGKAAKQYEKRRIENNLRDAELREQYEAQKEAKKRAHAENGCEMGEWVRITHFQFYNLLGRKKTQHETCHVRGCAHCPRIESQIRAISAVL